MRAFEALGALPTHAKILKNVPTLIFLPVGENLEEALTPMCKVLRLSRVQTGRIAARKVRQVCVVLIVSDAPVGVLETGQEDHTIRIRGSGVNDPYSVTRQGGKDMPSVREAAVVVESLHAKHKRASVKFFFESNCESRKKIESRVWFVHHMYLFNYKTVA